MSEQTDVVSGETDPLSEAADTYHETKVAAEEIDGGDERVVRVTDIVVDDDPDELYLCIEDGDDEFYVATRVKSRDARINAAEALSVSQGEPLSSVEGETVPLDFKTDRDGLPLRNTDTPEFKKQVAAPKYPYELESFERLVEFDRLHADGQHRGHDVQLDATATEDEVIAYADLPHGDPTWTFDVPTEPHEFSESRLREFVEAVGAGGPEGLDGHHVDVVPTAAVRRADRPTNGGAIRSDDDEYVVLGADDTDVEYDRVESIGVTVSAISILSLIASWALAVSEVFAVPFVSVEVASALGFAGTLFGVGVAVVESKIGRI